MKVIGLTGNIACGKSTASKILTELGAKIIDADIIAREVVLPGQKGYLGIKDFFGEEYFLKDRTLDRAKLGQAVFNDEKLLLKLNEILHPCIKERIKEELEHYRCLKEQPKAVIIDAALLFETQLDDLADENWLVYCESDIQLTRLRKRNGLSLAEAKARMDSQEPWQEKKDKADVLLNNDGTEEELAKKIEHLWATI